MAGVDQPAVDFAGQRGACQPGANALGYRGDRNRAVEGALGAIRQRDNRHGISIEKW
jgi:hypothetical protein